MKIALDTRDLGFATTGTRTYLQELLFALRAQQKEGITLIELSGMQWGTYCSSSAFLTKFIQQLSLLLWKQVVLPLRCRAAKADVLICTDYGVWGAEESHTHLGGSGYGGVAASRFDMG